MLIEEFEQDMQELAERLILADVEEIVSECMKTPPQGGSLYICQLDPDIPDLLKFGHTKSLSRRLSEHRRGPAKQRARRCTEATRKYPDAKYLGAWPLPRRLETRVIQRLACPYVSRMTNETYMVMSAYSVLSRATSLFALIAGATA